MSLRKYANKAEKTLKSGGCVLLSLNSGSTTFVEIFTPKGVIPPAKNTGKLPEILSIATYYPGGVQYTLAAAASSIIKKELGITCIPTAGGASKGNIDLLKSRRCEMATI